MAVPAGVADESQLGLDGDVARAGRFQLVRVDEESLVGVAWIKGQHAVVDVLLKAFAVVARRQSAAGGFGEQAGFDALCLRVVGHVLDDDTPFAIDVLGAKGTGVLDVGRADESFSADPVALVKLFAVVERIVEFLFLLLGDAIDQIVGRLVSHIGVFLQHKRVVVDGVLLQHATQHLV